MTLSLDEIKKKIQLDHFVGGERVRALSTETYTSLTPATNESIGTFVLGNEADMNRAIHEARRAFDEGPWPQMSTTDRAKILMKFSDLIQKNAEFLGAVESYDVGKLYSECVNHDVARASSNIRFFAGKMLQRSDDVYYNDAAFLGRKIKTMTVTRRDPIGVAALISPWNSPIMLATWKIGPCLATGNTCIVKPAPWALLSVLQLGELANEAGIPKGVLNIVPAGVEGGKALVAHRSVDRVSFTGSVGVGKQVNQSNAAVRLAPVSLELGGKSPTVVFADANIDRAVAGVAHGIFRSQGQSCVAGSRLLVEKSIFKEFTEKLAQYAKGMTIGNQLDEKSKIGPIITKEHLAKIEAMIASGVSEGGKILTGGKRPTDPALAKGNFLEPTLFVNVYPNMQIWRDEIFGPVLVAMPFEDEFQAVQLANDTDFGLSASVWTENFERSLRVTSAIQSGMVWVNSHFVRDLRAPFGGVKESGIGSEGGDYSIEFYTQPKMVCLPYAV